jgi:hypothetical protein
MTGNDFQDSCAGIPDLSSSRPHRDAVQIEHPVPVIVGQIVIFGACYGNLEQDLKDRQGVKWGQQQAAEQCQGTTETGRFVPVSVFGY